MRVSIFTLCLNPATTQDNIFRGYEGSMMLLSAIVATWIMNFSPKVVKDNLKTKYARMAMAVLHRQDQLPRLSAFVAHPSTTPWLPLVPSGATGLRGARELPCMSLFRLLHPRSMLVAKLIALAGNTSIGAFGHAGVMPSFRGKAAMLDKLKAFVNYLVQSANPGMYLMAAALASALVYGGSIIAAVLLKKDSVLDKPDVTVYRVAIDAIGYSLLVRFGGAVISARTAELLLMVRRAVASCGVRQPQPRRVAGKDAPRPRCALAGALHARQHRPHHRALVGALRGRAGQAAAPHLRRADAQDRREARQEGLSAVAFSQTCCAAPADRLAPIEATLPD